VAGRGVAEGDLVQIDYEAVMNGKPLEEAAPEARGLGRGKDFWVHAGENAFLPGFAEGLLGAGIGDKRQVFVDFPADFAQASLAGKSATYFVDIKALRERKVPALDPALLKELGVESEQQLREQIRTDLGRLGEVREKSRLKSEIVKRLLEQTVMALPASVVEEETRHAIYEIVRRNTARGASREQIEGHKEEIFDAATRGAGDKVKARYMLHRIAEEEKIEVTPEEVTVRVESLAREQGIAAPEMLSHLEKNNLMEGLRDEIRVDKTLDFLLEQAVVKR
jgi:trigger factor